MEGQDKRKWKFSGNISVQYQLEELDVTADDLYNDCNVLLLTFGSCVASFMCCDIVSCTLREGREDGIWDFSHITPTLKSLHWLKVNERIEYKILSLTYKTLHRSTCISP